MKAQHKVIKEITLVLTGEEAEWLKAQIQNPYICEKCQATFTVHHIDPESDAIRKKFWQALSNTSDDDI